MPLRPLITPFAQADDRRAWFQLVTTTLLFVAGWWAMAGSLERGWYGLFGLLALPVSGFFVRLFIFQHDCGHGSFFSRPGLNDAVGARDRRGDPDALHLLAQHPRHPPRHLGQPRAPRLRRHQHADRARVPGARPGRCGSRYRLYRSWPVLLGIGPLLPVRPQAPAPPRPAVDVQAGVEQRVAQQPRAGVRAGAACGSPSACAPRCSCKLPVVLLAGARGRLALLRAAPVRGHLLGGRRRVECRAGCPGGQLLLRPAARPALVQRQHRLPPHPPPGAAACRTIGCRSASGRTRACARPPA